MFGCYNQPMPANVLSLADVPPPMQRPPLRVGPPGFGPAGVDAMAEGFQALAEAGGDESMAIKPWLGSIKGPSAPAPLLQLQDLQEHFLEVMERVFCAPSPMTQLHSSSSRSSRDAPLSSRSIF